MKPEPNITRMDYERTHGWWVRFQRMDERGIKHVTSKHFGDVRHGGKRKALAAAKAWRDQMAPKLPRSKRRNLVTVPPGHGYVRRTELLGRSGERHPRWVAWMRDKARRNRQTSFSVTLWGERGAKLKAEQWLAKERAGLLARKRGRS